MPNASNLKSIQKYRKKAGRYDLTSHRTDWIRERTIDLLGLKPGDTVLDVGCGSGLSFEALQAGVGPDGRVIGFDQSAEMIALARERVALKRWSNITVTHDFGECFILGERIDAYLFHYTHDILQSEDAVRNILSTASPQARVAIAGMKYFPRWMEPLNVYAFFKNYAWNGNGSGLRKPWRHIEKAVQLATPRSTQLGMGYITSGIVRSNSADTH
jgi:arsenite methyltransferase